MIEQMKMMKHTLMNCVQGQMGDLASVDAKELGEAVDMIKDLSEAIYYCTITESMEKGDKEKEKEKYYPVDYYRDMDKPYGYMYYTDSHGVSHPSANMTTGAQGTRNYPIEIRDYREGRSPMTRKTYMERKMHGGAKELQMQELDKYVHELTNDIMEMLEGASAEEKQVLKSKISTLAAKIV
jgi:hypothetical protein